MAARSIMLILGLLAMSYITRALLSMLKGKLRERRVLIEISKLELGDSINRLNKSIENYEQAIQDDDPPEHIKAGQV